MRSLTVLAACILCNGVAAETVTIRSGQHESFSRLVLSVPQGMEWSLGRTGDDYLLTLQGEDVEFDLSEVFDRISTNRIAELRQQDGNLTIETACECHADAFLWRPDRLVVDIVDGPAPANSEFETEINVAMPEDVRDESFALPILTGPPRQLGRDPLIARTFDIAPASDSRVSDVERAIIESLARAASQGVFSLPSRPIPFVAEGLTEDDTPPPPGLPPITPVTDPMDGIPTNFERQQSGGGPGLVLRTSIERQETGEAGDSLEGGHCIADAQISIQDWGDDRDYSAQMSDRRLALVSEFDVYPPGAVEDLARTYLFFGFGREAIHVLSLDGGQSRERLILGAMAEIVDGSPKSSSIFDDQVDCDGFVVLWAILAQSGLTGVTDEGKNAAIMAFRLLPDVLRAHLGTTLATHFLDAGDASTADSIMTAVRSVETGANFELDLMSASLAGEIGGNQEAIEDLTALAEGNTRMTPDALARLIELKLDAEQVVEPSLLELAAALRFEAGEGEGAGRLAMAEIAAHAFANDFKSALDLLGDTTIPLTAAEHESAVDAVYGAMAERLSDADFLLSAFETLPVEMEPKTENAIAARLTSLGFPERALDVLEGPATQEAMAERRYLRAEALAAVSDIEGVDLALAGLNDQRANAIRARAYAATGDYEASLEQGLTVEGGEADPSEAWRAGAWTILESAEDPLLQSASRAVLAVPPDGVETATLAERLSLLDQAAETRSLSESLLGRFQVTPLE